MSFFALARDPMVSEIFESIRTPASADGKISFQEMQNYIAQQFIALQELPTRARKPNRSASAAPTCALQRGERPSTG